MIEDANELYRKGKFNDAEQQYRAILDDNPKNRQALLRLGELALWRNDTAEAEANLQTSLEQANWLQKTWLFSMNVKNLLAMTYYRLDDFPKASQFFKEAAGPIPISPFNNLKAIGNHLALFGKTKPYQIDSEATITIPFIITDPLPVVEASINGSDPLLFLLDSGGAELMLDIEVATQLGAEFAGTLSGSGGGTQGQMRLGKINSMRLGDIDIRHLPIYSLNLQHLQSDFDNLPIKGIIGTRLLMHFLATIDYPNAQLILRPKTADVTFPNALSIPFYLVQSHYIVAEGAINDAEPALFFVDTGISGCGFSTSEATLAEIGIPVDWSTAEEGVAGFGTTLVATVIADQVSLGTDAHQVKQTSVSGLVFKKPLEVLGHTLGFYIGGAVCHSFFRNYALTLDFAGMYLRLQKPT